MRVGGWCVWGPEKGFFLPVFRGRRLDLWV